MTKEKDGVLANEMVVLGADYLGEEAIAGNDASQDATLPTGTNFVEITAEGGAVYYALNDDADSSSGGYVPEDGLRYILKVDNLTSLGVYAATGTTAHLIYRQEP